MDNTIFMNNLRRYMDEYGLTQLELAKRCGVTTAAVNYWYQGKRAPKLEIIQKLCEILHCKPSDLLEEKKEIGYYDQEAAEMAQMLYDRKDMRILFDAAKGASPEEMHLVIGMLEQFKRNKSN